MSEHSVINSLINSSRKAAKFLQRDFFELEMLQNSTRGTYKFCQKSYARTKELLHEELTKNSYNNIIYTDQKLENIDQYQNLLLVQPIDSIDNLERAIPFFAISITYLQKTTNNNLSPSYCIINFPALNEIYYAQRGNGSWVIKNSFNSLGQPIRIRTSKTSDIRQSIIYSTNNSSVKLECKKSLFFNSNCYGMSLLASGKIDIVLLNDISPVEHHSFELIVREAGGFCSFINNQFIATSSCFTDINKTL